MNIAEIIQCQRDFFATGQTKDPAFRVDALQKLRSCMLEKESVIHRALREDLNKSPFETYMTELGMVLDELRYVRKHTRQWSRPKRVHTPLAQFHSKSFIQAEPYGVVLILSPWNYPFQLSLEPLVGALAAGNCVVLKPSAYAPHTARAVAEILEACFPPEYVAVVQGGRQENQDLLKQRFDYIFFTGGVTVGKLVMESAAEHLTPISLELGGKSPCIVDHTADLKTAARRLAFGKYLNAGQTCVAPDYLFVHEAVKDKFLALVQQSIVEFFGNDPLQNPNYPKIINQKHFERLRGLIQGETVLTGGKTDEAAQRIAPTILTGVTPTSRCMQEEIFGPILPVMAFTSLDEPIRYILSQEKPLALYLFTTSREAERRVLREVSFGGGCVNDTIIHLATPHMPFGGVGNSGLGGYHGKSSFDTFSHKKSIVKKYNWLDLPVRYHPYTKTKEKLLRMILK